MTAINPQPAPANARRQRAPGAYAAAGVGCSTSLTADRAAMVARSACRSLVRAGSLRRPGAALRGGAGFEREVQRGAMFRVWALCSQSYMLPLKGERRRHLPLSGEASRRASVMLSTHCGDTVSLAGSVAVACAAGFDEPELYATVAELVDAGARSLHGAPNAAERTDASESRCSGSMLDGGIGVDAGGVESRRHADSLKMRLSSAHRGRTNVQAGVTPGPTSTPLNCSSGIGAGACGVVFAQLNSGIGTDGRLPRCRPLCATLHRPRTRTLPRPHGITGRPHSACAGPWAGVLAGVFMRGGE